MKNLLSAVASHFSGEKYTVSSLVAALGGVFVSFIGGWDKLMVTYVTLMITDYVTGVIKAVYTKRLSSSIGFKGIMKKMLTICVVGLAVTLQNVIPADIPLREITIIFFIANEGISVLENAAGLIPLPKKIKDILLQLEDKSESDGMSGIKQILTKSGTVDDTEKSLDDTGAVQSDPVSKDDDQSTDINDTDE